MKDKEDLTRSNWSIIINYLFFLSPCCPKPHHCDRHYQESEWLVTAVSFCYRGMAAVTSESCCCLETGGVGE